MAQQPLATKGNYLHIYDFRVTKGKEDEFVRLFETFDYSDGNPMHKSWAQVKDGVLCRDTEDPQRFFLIAEWSDIEEHARIRADIEALGGVMVSTSSETLDNDRNFKILNAVSLAISIIALAMGVLYVLNSLVMATQERTREIGIVAAIGWSDTRIMGSIVIEGLVMCAIGCAFGVLISFFAAFVFPLIPTIGDMISFRPSLRLMATTIAAAFVLCAIGSLYPAWRAISLMPAEALRRA